MTPKVEILPLVLPVAFVDGVFDGSAGERGFFDGPKPVLLTETDISDAAVLILGNDKGAGQIEFGAHQVIIP